MALRDWFQNGMAFIMVCCLVALTWTRFFEPARPPSSGGVVAQVEGFEDLVAGARFSRGAKDPVVDVLAFIDFECPPCRAYSVDAERVVRAEYGDRVRFSVRHLPLGYHRMAEHAAALAECAGQQGVFFPMYDLLYTKQDSLGIKEPTSYAEEAGVPRISDFKECVKTDSVRELIQADIAAASQAGATGTPTVIVNGFRLPGTPDADRLARHIQEALNQVGRN